MTVRLAATAAPAPRACGAAALAVFFCATPGPAAQQETVLRVRADAARQEMVLEYGPIELPAGAAPSQVRQPAARTARFPVGGWLRGLHVELVDVQGRPVPREVLHHVNMMAPGRRELFSSIMQRIAAAGRETAPVRLPRWLGYRVRRGEQVLVTAMFHNPTPRSYHRVFLRARMAYTPADAWLRPLSIQPFYLDVMPPASQHSYDLPPGRSAQSWEGRPAVNARILGMGGHLHDYGVALRLEDVTEKRVIWESTPILDKQGQVIGMPTRRFFWRLGIPIYADHVYRLTAIYENPTGRTIEKGAMGALGGIVMVPRAESWPAADAKHAEYALDLALLTSGSRQHGHAHH